MNGLDKNTAEWEANETSKILKASEKRQKASNSAINLMLALVVTLVLEPADPSPRKI